MASSSNEIHLTINGRRHTVSSSIPPWTSLLSFLRDEVLLKSPKRVCGAGGCGACMVVAEVHDLDIKANKTFTIPACQASIGSCMQWSIWTAEGLGGQGQGYHKLQKVLTDFSATQCGFCSPGMLMAIYGAMNNGQTLNCREVEAALDGNLCRCTGYRPILDAFRALAAYDAPQHLKDRVTDIEDAHKSNCRNGDNGTCNISCSSPCHDQTNTVDKNTLLNSIIWPHTIINGVSWHTAHTIQDVMKILDEMSEDTNYYLVAGNTGKAFFPSDVPYGAYINISQVNELNQIQEPNSTSQNLVLGAAVTIARAIQIFERVSSNIPGYGYLQVLANHWKNVANTGVRNMASWGGNIMMKHRHQDWASDLFLTLAVIGTQIKLQLQGTEEELITDLHDFLGLNMDKGILIACVLPPMKEDAHIRTFKISPRVANTPGYLNASFRIAVDNEMRVVERPLILYGGISNCYGRCVKTEDFLFGRSMIEEDFMVTAAKVLREELKIKVGMTHKKNYYRIDLALHLLYKTVIGLLDTQIHESIRSGGFILERGTQTTSQDFRYSDENNPVGQPIRKIESLSQFSGEAEFVDDTQVLPGELTGVLVYTQYANAKINNIDISEARSSPGVVMVLTAADIPGVNNCLPTYDAMITQKEPVLADGYSEYAGQAVALVVAETFQQASLAAKKVRVHYKQENSPILCIKDALKAGHGRYAINFFTLKEEPHFYGDVEVGFESSQHILEGELEMGGQFPFPMEPLSTRVTPTEEGYQVVATTQWPDGVQTSIAQVLGLPANSIQVSVRRVGGAFGGKISRPCLVTAAAALGAWKTRRPTKITLDVQQYMESIGGREPFYTKYKVGFDSSGHIQALEVDLVVDAGANRNETGACIMQMFICNVYNIPNLTVRPMTVTTDTPPNTYMRAPGSVHPIAAIETIIEHIAHHLRCDPLAVREINYAKTGVPRPFSEPLKQHVFKDNILPLLKEKSNFQRKIKEVEAFNKSHLWHKRGLSILPMLFSLHYFAEIRYGAHVAIYQHDGSVAVAHGGVEMGQGLNTKVSQVASLTLGVPLDKVKVLPSNTFVGANSTFMGDVCSSDIVCNGIMIACKHLRLRLDKCREIWLSENKNEPTWVDLVRFCYTKDIDLSEHYW
ncbi:unnamed protein product, partial [Meganyctiphanes norvegica]